MWQTQSPQEPIQRHGLSAILQLQMKLSWSPGRQLPIHQNGFGNIDPDLQLWIQNHYNMREKEAFQVVVLISKHCGKRTENHSYSLICWGSLKAGISNRLNTYTTEGRRQWLPGIMCFWSPHTFPSSCRSKIIWAWRKVILLPKQSAMP